MDGATSRPAARASPAAGNARLDRGSARGGRAAGRRAQLPRPCAEVHVEAARGMGPNGVSNPEGARRAAVTVLALKPGELSERVAGAVLGPGPPRGGRRESADLEDVHVDRRLRERPGRRKRMDVRRRSGVEGLGRGDLMERQPAHHGQPQRSMTWPPTGRPPPMCSRRR